MGPISCPGRSNAGLMLTSRPLGLRLEGALHLSDKRIPHLIHFSHPLLCPSSLYKHSILPLRLNGKGKNPSYVAVSFIFMLKLLCFSVMAASILALVMKLTRIQFS